MTIDAIAGPWNGTATGGTSTTMNHPNRTLDPMELSYYFAPPSHGRLRSLQQQQQQQLLSIDQQELDHITSIHIMQAFQDALGQGVILQLHLDMTTLKIDMSPDGSSILSEQISGFVIFTNTTVVVRNSQVQTIVQNAFLGNPLQIYVLQLQVAQDSTLRRITNVLVGPPTLSLPTGFGPLNDVPNTQGQASSNSNSGFALNGPMIAIIVSVVVVMIAVCIFTYIVVFARRRNSSPPSSPLDRKKEELTVTSPRTKQHRQRSSKRRNDGATYDDIGLPQSASGNTTSPKSDDGVVVISSGNDPLPMDIQGNPDYVYETSELGEEDDDDDEEEPDVASQCTSTYSYLPNDDQSLSIAPSILYSIHEPASSSSSPPPTRRTAPDVKKHENHYHQHQHHRDDGKVRMSKTAKRGVLWSVMDTLQTHFRPGTTVAAAATTAASSNRKNQSVPTKKPHTSALMDDGDDHSELDLYDQDYDISFQTRDDPTSTSLAYASPPRLLFPESETESGASNSLIYDDMSLISDLGGGMNRVLQFDEDPPSRTLVKKTFETLWRDETNDDDDDEDGRPEKESSKQIPTHYPIAQDSNTVDHRNLSMDYMDGFPTSKLDITPEYDYNDDESIAASSQISGFSHPTNGSGIILPTSLGASFDKNVVNSVRPKGVALNHLLPVEDDKNDNSDDGDNDNDNYNNVEAQDAVSTTQSHSSIEQASVESGTSSKQRSKFQPSCKSAKEPATGNSPKSVRRKKSALLEWTASSDSSNHSQKSSESRTAAALRSLLTTDSVRGGSVISNSENQTLSPNGSFDEFSESHKVENIATDDPVQLDCHDGDKVAQSDSRFLSDSDINVASVEYLPESASIPGSSLSRNDDLDESSDTHIGNAEKFDNVWRDVPYLSDGKESAHQEIKVSSLIHSFENAWGSGTTITRQNLSSNGVIAPYARGSASREDSDDDCYVEEGGAVIENVINTSLPNVLDTEEGGAVIDDEINTSLPDVVLDTEEGGVVIDDEINTSLPKMGTEEGGVVTDYEINASLPKREYDVQDTVDGGAVIDDKINASLPEVALDTEGEGVAIDDEINATLLKREHVQVTKESGAENDDDINGSDKRLPKVKEDGLNKSNVQNTNDGQLYEDSENAATLDPDRDDNISENEETQEMNKFPENDVRPETEDADSDSVKEEVSATPMAHETVELLENGGAFEITDNKQVSQVNEVNKIPMNDYARSCETGDDANIPGPEAMAECDDLMHPSLAETEKTVRIREVPETNDRYKVDMTLPVVTWSEEPGDEPCQADGEGYEEENSFDIPGAEDRLPFETSFLDESPELESENQKDPCPVEKEDEKKEDMGSTDVTKDESMIDEMSVMTMDVTKNYLGLSDTMASF